MAPCLLPFDHLKHEAVLRKAINMLSVLLGELATKEPFHLYHWRMTYIICDCPILYLAQAASQVQTGFQPMAFVFYGPALLSQILLETLF